MGFIIELNKNGYLKTKIEDGQELYFLVTPCRFRIEDSIVKELKNKYKSDEEIGGVFWAKPTRQDGEIIYSIDRVCFIRNAIDDNPRNDHRNKSNAYRPDQNQLKQEINNIFTNGSLPIRFHTHPTKGTDFLKSLVSTNLQTEVSEQDKKASYSPFDIGGKKLIMPRALIVGNDISKHDIFIGIYNGFIAPTEFVDSKNKIQQENLQKITDFISNINLTDSQKFGLAIGALLLLYTIIKYPKYNMYVIIALGTILSLAMTGTQNIEKPNYFNRLSSGSADIFIPNIEK